MCFINYEGSSGGMEPEAALEMIQNIQNNTKNAIFISTICADDDTTLRCIIKNVRDGGKLQDNLKSPCPVSDPGHRIKNTTGVVWKLCLQPLSLSSVRKPMARTFEFGMRAAMRGNCSKDINKFQDATKAPLLHMFNIHTHCTESFCSIRKQSRETYLNLCLIH